MSRRATKTTNPPTLPDRGLRSTALPPLCTDGCLSPAGLGHLLQLRPRRGKVCRSRPPDLDCFELRISNPPEQPKIGDRTGPGRGDRGLSGFKTHELALLFWTEPVCSHLAAFHRKCQGGISLLLGRSDVLQAAGWAGGLLTLGGQHGRGCDRSLLLQLNGLINFSHRSSWGHWRLDASRRPAGRR